MVTSIKVIAVMIIMYVAAAAAGAGAAAAAVVDDGDHCSCYCFVTFVCFHPVFTTAVPPRYPKPDPNSNPGKHGGVWGPWE